MALKILFVIKWRKAERSVLMLVNKNLLYRPDMPNKKQIRIQEFELHREWARKQTTEDLKKWLENAKRLSSGEKTAAREVLRERGDI